MQQSTWITQKLSTYREALDCFTKSSAADDGCHETEGPLTLCIMHILAKATYLESLSSYMKHKFTSTSLFDYKHVPFMSSILSLFHHKQYSPLRQSCEEHLQRWTGLGYERVPILGDGNCLRAYVTQLHDLTEQSPELDSCISQIGINVNDTEERLIQKLRQLIVSEWLDNPKHYDFN